MDPRIAKGSTSQVFLTEAQTTVTVPVRLTQHSLDDNPEFADFLKNQQKTVASLYSTGLQSSSSFLLSMPKELARHRAQERFKASEQAEAEKAAFLQRISDWKSTREANRELAKAKQERHWRQMQAKISFPDPGKDYYDQTPLRPGMWFWKYLLTSTKVPVSRLKVWIPELLTIFEEVHWAYTEPEKGNVVVSNDFSIGSLYKSFEKYKNGATPCAVLRLPGESASESKAILLNWFDLGEKVLKGQLPTLGVIQTLIKCHGARPTIIRLFHIAQSKTNRASYAYSISNTDVAMKNYYVGKYVVCADYHDGIEITPQYGAALRTVKDAGRRIVEYLQQAYLVRFEEIVLDFIRDEQNRVWLLSCKGYRIDMAVQRVKEMKLWGEEGLSDTETKELREAQRDEQLSAVHCTLCRLPYKSFQMKHVLPFKVLLIYKQHTYRSERKRLDLSHIKVTSPDFLSHWVSVCEICYMLLVQEYELLEAEMHLAALLNVPVSTPQLSGTFDYDQPNFMPETMHQWRLLFYFQQIESDTCLLNRSKLHLQYYFLNEYYHYDLQLKWEGNTASLQVARLYYFFAVKNPLVVHFCQSTSVHFRITRSRDWADVVAVGECKPLALFATQLADSSAVVQVVDLLLFQEAEIVARIKLKVGLACDRPVRVKDLPVTITKLGNLYIPENSFFTSDSVPDAWMETFEETYQGLRLSQVVDSSVELEQMYSPVMGEKAFFTFDSPNSLAKNSSSRISTLESNQFGRKSTEPSTRRVGLMSENTSTSSRVLYQVDSVSGIKSPTFLTCRQSFMQKTVKETENSGRSPIYWEESKAEKPDLASESQEIEEIISQLAGKSSRASKKSKKKLPIADSNPFLLQAHNDLQTTNSQQLQSTEASKKKLPIAYSNPFLLQADKDLQTAKSQHQQSTEASLQRTLKDLPSLISPTETELSRKGRKPLATN